jgi:predicted RNA methylase
MTKYDNLDSRREIEQEIAKDLKRAFAKRGLQIKHNGTDTTHAPAGVTDIEVFNDKTQINIEITKSVKSSQDREWQSIKDHFEESIKKNSNKNCFLIFISPETYYRTINSIKDWNFSHKKSKDKKIMPICFSTFELLINKLIESTKEKYSLKELLNLFDNFVKFIDDECILREFYENLFNTDSKLKNEIEKREEERHQKVVKELISGFKQLEQKLRDEGIATGERAIKNVIYLVFIKLYEEKNEKEESQRNRFTLSTFRDYQDNVRDKKKAIDKLFDNIKNDPELKACKLFSNEDLLAGRLEDNFVITHFIEPFEPYAFYTTKVDGLGAAYEVLGQLSGKDTKLGQFFTPENVVKFMVKLAELETDDVVFDPACGTARFLTHAMEDMVNKTVGIRDQEDKIESIKRKQLLGTDFDATVAKLAKMNMYIHGDGKTNVLDEDGLTQTDKDKKIDVILTNPPLGDLDYYSSRYDNDFRSKRMEVIPKKDLTKEKLTKTEQDIKNNLEKLSKETRTNKIERIKERVKELEKKQSELQYKIDHDGSEYIISGKLMKGGGSFLECL